MSSRSTVSDSPPAVPAPAEMVSDSTASSPDPSKAGDCWPAAESHADVAPRPGQNWRQVSAEERLARYEEYKRRLAEIDAEDDTPEEVYDEVMRNIDEERRRQGRPPAFEGCY